MTVFVNFPVNIESWGRGIRKIVDGMTQAVLARPKIEDADGGVRITIYRNTDVSKDVPKNVPKNVPEELTGIKKRIYELIQADPSVSRTQIAVECGMSVKTIARYPGYCMKALDAGAAQLD